MSQFNAYLLKLLPGAIAIILIAGFSYYLGLKHKQNEVDALQNQLTEYRRLGEKIDSIKSVIEKDMEHKNKALIDAYNKEIEAIQADFNKTRNDLAQATEVLKKRGATLNTTASLLAKAIRELPPGEERNKSIKEFVALFMDPLIRQEICATTPVEESQMKQLKLSFNIGAK